MSADRDAAQTRNAASAAAFVAGPIAPLGPNSTS
jgi:hypothetical protein